MLKIDLHLHSQYSEDASGSPKELKTLLKKRGLQGMAITDHNTIRGGLEAKKLSSQDFIVIPGVEISTADGHLIGLDVSENIPKHLSVEETVERIGDLGGIPIVPHLFRNMSGIKVAKLHSILSKISAIEVFNSCSLPQTNLKIVKVAKELDLGGTGGSDAHDPQYAGYAYTTVNTTDLTKEGILAEILKKQTWGEGQTMPLEYRRDRMTKSIKQFFQRGLKRI